MPTDDAIQLIREAKRGGTTLLNYNGELVRNVINEIKYVFDEAQRTYLLLDRSDESLVTKGFMLQLMLKRYQRCLLAYHNSRIETIKKVFHENQGSLTAEVNSLLSAQEKEFVKCYAQLRQKHQKRFPSLNFHASDAPPKGLFIEVRVIKDCGIIQTESGELALTENSYHFVKRYDVEHLIKQGYLIHVK